MTPNETDSGGLPPGFADLPEGEVIWRAGLAAPEALIPHGGYCYRVLRSTKGETLERPGSWFGDRQREAAFHPGRKRQLCPYWTETAYGTVRCEWLGVEQITQRLSDAEAIALIAAKFGPDWSDRGIRHGNWLPDEIKICSVNEYDDDGCAGEGCR